MRLFTLALFLYTAVSVADIARVDYDHCRGMVDDATRLRCFDRLGTEAASAAASAPGAAPEGAPRIDPSAALDPFEKCDNSTVRCGYRWDPKSDRNPMFGRLTSNEPNYFVYVPDGDDDRINFNLSLKYPFYDGGAFPDTGDAVSGRLRKSRVYLMYNGTFDFFVNSRASSPVISRRHNPGIAYQYNWREQRGPNPFDIDAVRIGWYHESNGQSIETREQYEQSANGLDYVSRGWDYLGTTVYASHGAFAHELEVRAYCDCQAFGLVDGREDNIFWEDVDEQPNINDFDGLRYRMEWQWHKWLTRFELKTGNRDAEALENLSGKISLAHQGNFPVSLFYFKGYGRELSSYHLRNDYVGIGIELR
jgi:outer membrane phospholipase A